MTKNIIIFSDGTGKEGDKGFPSNVFKLYRQSENNSARQISFYDAGVGTDWRKITGSVFGNGISLKVQRCYKFILDNYENGDDIFLFGFSRGAYTVRALAGIQGDLHQPCPVGSRSVCGHCANDPLPKRGIGDTRI